MRTFVFSVLTSIFIAAQLSGASPKVPDAVEQKRDINYAGDTNPAHMLDLYLPKKPAETARPLVVFIHGGGWQEGDKDQIVGLLYAMIQDGAFVGASINYRLSGEAKWPAQIHDCKGALRWLRAHAKEYNFDPEKVGIMGISAGGHLVSLIGTSGGVAELEGGVGGNTEQSSRAQCVINLCGVSDMLTLKEQGTIFDPDTTKAPFFKLFGGPLSEHRKEATVASPITHVSTATAPFLHVHGTKDPLVPFAQSIELSDALKKNGVSTTMITGKNGGHVFATPEMLKMMRLFLEKHLLGASVDVHDIEVEVK